jgi:Zn-dependent metalloprotease
MRDPSVVTHEVAHAVIEQVSHLSTEGEGGSLNEAFADYFAASILDNPKMGEVSYVEGPYRRDIDNDATLAGRNGGLYHDSLIVSGTLWALRQALGTDAGQAVAFKTLSRLNADSNLVDFKTQLTQALAVGLSPDQTHKAQAVLAARGWN